MTRLIGEMAAEFRAIALSVRAETHPLWVVLEQVWGGMLATYRSYGACWSRFGAVCWQPAGLMGRAGAGLGLYVGNLQV